MTGANDPDNRRMMYFENHTTNEELLLKTIKKLTTLRKNNTALVYGDMNMLHVSDSKLLYSRNYFEDVIYVAFNKSAKEVQIELAVAEANLKDLNGTIVHSNTNKLTLTIPAYGYEIRTDDY